MWQLVLNGPGYLDTPYDLPEGETSLGRADENDIVLSGDLVSRRHARFRRSGDGVQVEDLGSRNGTKVNGEKIDGPRALRDGDVVGIGENRVDVHVREAALEARTDVIAPPPPVAGTGAAALARPPPPGVKPPPPPISQAAPSPRFVVAKGSAEAAKLDGPVLLRRDAEAADALAQLQKARALHAGEVLADRAAAPELASLVLLYQVSERLANALSIEAFLQDVCDLVMDVAKAKTVVALLASPDGSFEPAVIRHRGAPLARGEIPVSSGVLAECVRSRVVLCVADAGSDRRFSGRESVVLYAVSQALCIPLLRGDDVVGVLYVTRESRDGSQIARLVDSLTAIGHLTASGIEQHRLRERAAEEARVRRVLERFHAPDIVDRVVSDFGSGGPRMEERLATTVFADISGFTPLTERLPAEKIVALLDDFYRAMTGVVFSFGGTVDKFIGDAVMAIFGAPYPRGDDPARAVRAALAMRAEFDRLMERRPQSERCRLNVGVNTGRVLVGTVGGEGRLEYTAVGDAVNVAARLCSAAEPHQILVSGATLAHLDGRFSVRPLGPRQLKGKREPVEVFLLLEEDLDVMTSIGPRPRLD